MTDSQAGRTGGTANQRILDLYRERFRQACSGADGFLEFLRRSDVGVWRFEQDTTPTRWWINVTLPPHQQTIFGLNREMQVLYTEYENVEPRTLSVMQNRVRKDMRVEPDVAVLVSRDKRISDTTRRRAGELAIVTVDLDQIAAGDSELFHTLIARSVASVDHFDLTTPVRDPSGFYGREREIEAIAADLKRVVSVGIFGLRKAGKTSLLNALAALRADDDRNATVRVDVSEIVTAEQFRTIVLEGMWTAVRRTPGNENARPRLRTLTRDGTRRLDLPDSATSWIQDLRVLLEHVEVPAVLIVDEVDQAFPPRSNLESQEAHNLFQSLVQLRSLFQQQESLALLCAGVDPAMFEKPLLKEAKDNLLYKLVRLVWLAPMPRHEMADMVRSLGRRMGVRVRGHAEIDMLFRELGGHPLLTRRACSIAAKSRTPETLPFHLTSQLLTDALNSSDYGGPREQAADVLASFTEWFPAEAALLRLYYSPDVEERDLARLLIRDDPDAMLHSVAYGLCFPDHTARISAAIETLEN